MTTSHLMPNPDQDRILPTRRSLLSRLRNWDDQDSWRSFFETYWRLIYDVAIKAGLNDAEAQDVVQETILAVAKQMPDFKYDPAKGRFKSWLHQLTRRRIMDHFRRRYREIKAGRVESGDTSEAESVPAEANAAGSQVDEIWEREWQLHLTTLALERVKRRVRPEHFQIFDLYVMQHWPVTKIAKALGVSLPLIYVTRHRVGAMLKKEIGLLQDKLL